HSPETAAPGFGRRRSGGEAWSADRAPALSAQLRLRPGGGPDRPGRSAPSGAADGRLAVALRGPGPGLPEPEHDRLAGGEAAVVLARSGPDRSTPGTD